MIYSKTIKIKKTENFDNLYIEQELAKQYNSVIRWAIVDIDEDITISVSYNRHNCHCEPIGEPIQPFK